VYLGVLLTGSLLNAVLFFRILEKAYFELRDESGHAEPHGRRRLLIDRIPVTELAPMVALAILLILLGLFSNTIISGVIEHAIPQTMRVY